MRSRARLASLVEEVVEEVEVEVEEVLCSLIISRHSGLLPFHFLPSIQPRTGCPLTEYPGAQLKTATVLLNSSSSSTSPLEGRGGA